MILYYIQKKVYTQQNVTVNSTACWKIILQNENMHFS